MKNLTLGGSRYPNREKQCVLSSGASEFQLFYIFMSSCSRFKN